MAKRIRTINTESLQKTAKTGGCGNVKHLANPLVKQAAQLVTKFANKNNEEARLAGLFYLCFKDIHCIVYLYDSFYNV